MIFAVINTGARAQVSFFLRGGRFNFLCPFLRALSVLGIEEVQPVNEIWIAIKVIKNTSNMSVCVFQ